MSDQSSAQPTVPVSVPDLNPDIAGVMQPQSFDENQLTSYTSPGSQSLATTIKNTMRLGIQEMSETFSRSIVSRDVFDPNAVYSIPLFLVSFEREMIEMRKPLT